MNSMIRELFICAVQLCAYAISAYLVMDLFSVRAKITRKRIRNYIIYGIIMYTALIGVLGMPVPRGLVLYTGVWIICFLFEEKQVLTKAWKVIAAVCIESLLEFVCNLFGDWFFNNVWNHWLVYNLMVNVLTACIITTAVIIVRKLKIFKQTKVESIIFLKSEAILLCMLGICALVTNLIANAIYVYDGEIYISTVNLAVWGIGNTLAAICLILGIDKNIAENYYQKVNELIEKQFKNQVNYYEKIEESNKEIRAIKHDMKNHLISMQGLLHNNQLQELDEYIEDIRTTISKKVSLIKTGNTIVDAILNEKSAVAHDKDIVMEIEVGVQQNMGIELIDLCIMLSNSIDNAIEACERIEDISSRKIKIKCNYQAGYFFYEITNPMKEEKISGVKNKLRTIKKDKENHGFGVGNITQSARKYGGEVRTSADNFVFKLEIEINTREIVALQA